jgi:small subunit ribosomal protein S20
VANIKGQIKRNRQNQTRRLRNQTVRTELKTRVKAARVAADEGSGDTEELVRQAQQRLAQAGSKGRIHPRQASRRTSRLMKRAAKGAQG